MAVFRKIHVTFWSDSFVAELTDKEKLFYIYLLTNERTTQIGVYEITKRQMSFDLGYSINTVSELLQRFIKLNKIAYNESTNEVSIRNWNKYNDNKSVKVQVLCEKERNKVKDKGLIEYQYCIDTVPILNPQEEEEKEQEIEEEKEQIDFDGLLKLINMTFDKQYKKIPDPVRKSFVTRFTKDKYTKDQFRLVLTNCLKDPFAKQQKYNFCTPEYLSRVRTFEKYLNFDTNIIDIKKQEEQRSLRSELK